MRVSEKLKTKHSSGFLISSRLFCACSVYRAPGLAGGKASMACCRILGVADYRVSGALAWCLEVHRYCLVDL